MKHKLTRLTALMLAVILSFSTLLVPVQAASFTDVPEKAWYRKAVEYVSDKGWMNGVGEMTFAPTMDVTRGMFVTLLAAYADVDVDNSNAAFADTGAGKWYTGAAAWAAEQEIVKGIGSGQFAPNRSISRQDLCTMLYKYLQSAGIQLKADSDRTYADFSSVSPYAREAVAFCAASGLVTGFEDSSFRPKNTATRAQVAQILMRLDQLRQGEELPEDPMPAQSFEPVEAGEMTVSVEAPQGALPEGSSMTVDPVTDEAALASIREKIAGKLYAAADITFFKDEVKIEPSAEVEVQISMDGLENLKNPAVVHVRPDGSVEYVQAELVSANRSGNQKALRFYAKDFSVYAVTEELGDDVTVTVNFYVRKNGASGPSANAGDWEIINRQILRKTQIESAETPFIDPGVPNLSANQSFEGWFYGSGSFTESDTGESVAEINVHAKQDLPTANATWDFYAMVYNVVYVVFHDQAGAVLRTTPYHVAEGTSYANAMINMTYAPFKDNQNFTGWVTRKDVLTLGDYPTYKENPDPVIRNNTEYTVTETLELYPYLQDGYWLIFDPNIANNDSDPTKCEYKGPDFVPKGTLTSEPTFKNEHPRPGYDLEGWYTDPALRNRYTFGQALTKDTTLYAKWTPIEASYTVVFRVQNATDPYDNDVSNNTYSFYDSVSRSWRNTTGTYVQTKSGDTVSAFSRGTSNDTTLASAGIAQNAYYPKAISALGRYYQYSTQKNANNSVTVRGDGSAVLYVYYDRMPVTLNFYDGTFSSSTSDTMYVDSYGYSYYYTYLQYFGVSGNSAIPLTLVYNSSNTTDNGNLIYTGYASFKVTSTGASYRGDIYVFLQGTTSGTLIASITGLYGAEISDTDKAKFKVEDPYVYCYESGTNSSGNTTYTLMPDVSTYAPGSNYSGNAYTINYFCCTNLVSTGEKTLHQISQNPDTGEWGEEYGSDTVTNRTGVVIGNSTGRTFIGYNLSEDSMTKSTFVSLDGNTTYTFRYENINGNNAYAYKQLNNYDLVFMSNSGEVRRETLRYRQHTAAFAYKRIDETTLSTTELFIPDDGPEGYYFEGWYTDNTFQNKYSFTGRMPARNLTLYAKWTMTRYRVFLDYAGGDSEAQISFPDGTYSSTWRLDYGEQVDENRIANVTRDGWVLLGWYLDPEFKHAFNFSMGANDGMLYNDEEYYYGLQMPGESDEAYAARMNGSTRRGTDPLSGSAWDDTWDTDWESHDYSGEYVAAGYESADKMRTARGEKHNVVHTIRLYAKWRQDPKGTIGIRVNYLGDHSETDTGYFNTDGQPHIWKDPELYVDRADAYAQAASVPDNANEHFLYWEILDEDGNPTGRVAYPGQTWQVRLEDAAEVRVPVPNPNCAHDGGSTHVEAKDPTCTEKGNVEYWSCNLCGKYFSDETLSTVLADPFTDALGHTWGEWQYQQNGQGGHYHICSVCQTRAGGAHVMEQTAYTAPTTTSEGSKTETCSVCGYSKTTTLPKLQGYTVSFSVPAGVTKPADQTGLEDGASVTLPTSLTGVPAGYTFLGWVENPVTETTDTVTPIASFTVNGDDATLYALFSRTEGSSYEGYKLVTEAPSSWANDYVITYDSNPTNMYVLTGLSGTTNYESASSGGHTAFASTGIQLKDNVLTNVADNYVFTVGTAANSLYSIRNKATSTYLRYYYASGYYLYADTTNSSTYSRWTFAMNGSGNAVNVKNNYGTYYLAFSSSTYFILNTSASAAIFLWAKTTISDETTYYSTSIGGGETPDPAEGYTVTYYADGRLVTAFPVDAGTEITVGQDANGNTLTTPTMSNGTFVGWVSQQYSGETTQPTLASGTVTVNSSLTYYALFSQGNGGTSSTKWTKATAVPATGTEFIIAYGTSAMQNAARGSSTSALPSTSFTTEDGCIVTSDDSASGLDVSGHTFVLENDTKGTLIKSTVSSSTMYIHFNYSSSSRRIAIATSTSNSYVDVAASGNGFTVIGNAAANSWSNNTNRCLSTTFTNSDTAGVLDFYIKTTVQSGGTVYTTGTQVSGGNAVTEPEKPEADEQPTRGLDVPKPVTEDTVTYQLASSVEVGKTYLIVYGSAATAAGSTTMRAMNSYSATTSGYLRAATPEFSDSTHSVITGVTTDKGTIADCEWTVGEGTMNADGVYTFYNVSDGSNYYLYESSSSDGNLSASKNPTNTNYTNWAVRRVNTTDPYVYLTNYYWDSQSSTYFYFLRYSSSGFSNYYASSAIDSARLYLYEKVENTTPKYTLTIHYQYADGSQADEDYVGQYEAGSDYSVTSPVIIGYTANYPIVSGTMPSGDHSRTVTYNANTVSNERWEPTQTIVPGEDYLIAYVLNGKPYLLVNYNVSAENHYSYDLEVTSSSGTSTAPLGYLAPATVVTENGTEYVSGVNGAATDLQYCHWIFSDANGGTITSGYESGRSLYWNGLLSGTAGVSPQTSGDTWVWVPNSTGNMGAMRNSYTSSSGTSYTFYFYPRTATGAESTSTTAPYAGVSQTSFTNVRLYHKVVTQDTTWTVSFVDEDGVSMADEGYPSYETTEGSTVARPADPQRQDYYFLGWYYVNSEGQEVAYNFGQEVHGDLTLIAHFLYAWEVQYTITLRAVYGIPNTTGRTFIYWYANDGTDYGHGVGAGDRFEMLEMDQNVAYNIPTPNGAVPTVGSPANMGWTGGSQYYHDAQGNATVSFQQNDMTHQDTLGGPERVFLGWARIPVPSGESGTVGTAHPELTEDDLYLKWTGTKYQYKNDQGVWTDLPTGAVGQVYATDDSSYHDMYAVWASYAYVFHSATGKMEAVEVKRGVNVDLVSKVPEGYLYGGYYTEYGGVKGIVSDADLNTAKSLATQNCYSADHAGGSAAAKLVAVNGAVTYNGESIKNANNARFWTKAKAYGYGAQADAPSGNKLTPTVGTVYYVKEVPETYLTTKYLYTYNISSGVIENFFMVTATDDTYYSNVGFRCDYGPEADAESTAKVRDIIWKDALVSTFSVVQGGDEPVPVNVTAADFGLKRGYVGVKNQDSLASANNVFTVMPVWQTLDGVEVNSRGALKLTVNAAKTAISYELLGTVSTPYTSIYVNVNPVKNDWLSDGAITRLYFFGDPNKADEWVETTAVTGKEGCFKAEIPEGSWTGYIVVRCAKDSTLDDGWDAKWNQTSNIAFQPRVSNLVTITGTNGPNQDYNYTTGVYNPN